MKRAQLLAEFLRMDEQRNDGTTQVAPPATTPIPSIESADIEQAIIDATTLTQAQAAARAVREADVASGQIQFNLESLHSTLTKLNQEGGVTRDQYELAYLAVESQCNRLEIPVISFGIKLESFTEEAPMHVVSLEDLNNVIAVIDSNHQALSEDAHEAVENIGDTLKTAVPNAAARLIAYVNRVEQSDAVLPEGMISGEGIAACLMRADSFPENFSAYMDSYCALGMKLAGPYMNTVGKAVQQVTAFQNVSFESVDAFNNGVRSACENAVDPRDCLSDSDYETPLPGEGPLFVDTDHCSVGDDYYSKLDCAVHCRTAIDPDEYQPDTLQIPTTLPRLTTNQILEIGKNLHAVAMECDVAQFMEDVCEGGNEIDNAIHAFTKAFDEASPDVSEAVEAGAVVVHEYLQNLRTMTKWTPVWFMTNLVQTINAFLVYAERSCGMDSVGSEEESNAVSTEDNNQAKSGNESGGDVPQPPAVELDANKVSDLSGEGKDEHPTEVPTGGEPSKPQDGGAPDGADGKTEAGKPAQSGNEAPGTDKEVSETPAPSGDEPGPNAPQPPNMELDANKVEDTDVKVATESTPAAEQPPVEGTPSTEAYPIKLKTGMKVKYSHGYGKIIKVFDRPMKYKGKIEHCSKDRPRYEVRSDDGRHLSLHHASALTPLM